MAILQIPISKGGGTIAVNTDAPEDRGDLPANVFAAALAEGLKVLLNKGMTKILTKDLEGDDLAKAQTAAMEKAQENLAQLRKGQLKATRARATDGKIPGVVMTEARRLAKNIIKDALKAAGEKVSYYKASVITDAANAYLASDDGKSLIEQAKATVATREAEKAKGKDVALAKLAGLKPDPDLIKAADAAAAKRKKEAKTTLSAAAAGKVKSRPKPQANA